MKNLAMLTMACLCLMGCSLLDNRSSFDYVITDKNWNSQTFLVIKNVNMPGALSEPIESGIEKRFHALGYQLDDRHPDVLVHYTIYDGTYTLETWVQPKMRHWLESTGPQEEFERRTRKIKGESIYISVFDNIHNKVIWRGYDTMSARSQRMLQAKVYQVLDEFTLTANRLPEKITPYKEITSVGDF
ncbi:MAG: DUF4136 domain-containing protein [Bacteroidota bacterium]